MRPLLLFRCLSAATVLLPPPTIAQSPPTTRDTILRPPHYALAPGVPKIPPNDTSALRQDVDQFMSKDAIREIQPYFRGDFAVVLRDGSHVITGRTYRDRIRKRFSLS